MQSQIRTMQGDWEALNDEFQTVIERIPDKRIYESVTDYLYSLIINHGLKIQNYSPSNAAIDKKDIFITETGEELLIEKIPIDITVKGSFISFGQLLESMLTSQFRLTASNIEVAQKDESYALKTDGTLWSWGYNNKGQLGHNDVAMRSSPTQIPGTDWSFIQTGGTSVPSGVFALKRV